MGEVYRADDLTLDHPVALKFLPSVATGDEAKLSQFHNELRVARQVSHKNVCRLYDLGEAGGRRFLTMEYVDGEDLASLIRRIGRLPHDKAVQIARQLCAGVAAAHDRGVLHRDLKPANVMIDGAGDVRITDFGIATAASEGANEFVGTPHYMAPEQFRGGAASVRSDIYALGLILFEVFTGRRAQDSKTLEELKKFHETGTHTTPSSIVRDLDPSVERVILRCLERPPERRPISALAVAAALPGGDPLAAALAAGETPSPEVLAAAGESDALGVGWALALVSFVVVALLAFAAASQRTSLTGRTPLDVEPPVLVDRAEQLVSSVGYNEPPGDTAFGFMPFEDYRQWLRRRSESRSTRWDALSSGDPSGVLFWYRSAPGALIPVEDAAVTPTDPPATETGMREVVLDPRGRLQRFRSVPPQFDDSADPARAPAWNTLFDAAGLSMSAFAEATPQWTPPDFADARAAWTGPHPLLQDVTMRVEAASYRGAPVFFEVIWPWTEPERMQPDRTSLADFILIGVLLGILATLLLAAAVLARHHIRSGRADRRSAWRLTAYLAVVGMVAWLLRADHSLNLEGEVGLLFREAANLALLALTSWTVYVALEPYVRRLWPDALLGWSRLLTGHIRDPRVGCDLLIGMAFGVALALVDVGKATIIPALGLSAPYPRYGYGDVMLGSGTGALWGTLLESASAVIAALLATLGIVILRLVLRWRWLAIVVTWIFLSLTTTYDMSAIPVSLAFPLASGTLLTIIAFRFGLLALVVTWFTWGLIEAVPMTLQLSHWRAVPSNWTLAVLFGLTLYGFYASRAGQPLFGKILRD
jgi:serine/threonine-protein kinase